MLQYLSCPKQKFPEGFVLLQFFFYFLTQDLRGLSTDRRQVKSMFNFIMPVWKFSGMPPPKEKWEVKRAKFGSISDSFPL